MPGTVSGAAHATEAGPWNPGIRSQIPRAFLPLATIYRSENVFTTVEQALELADFTGLAAEDLVVFRPERLVVHELLIRVTADFSVPDGPKYEDLGINFRLMVDVILTRYIARHMGEITDAYQALSARVAALIDDELATSLFAPPGGAAKPASESVLRRLFARPRVASGGAPGDDIVAREQHLLEHWREMAERASDPLEAAAYRELARVTSAIRARHGRIRGARTLLVELVAGQVCNEWGSEQIGRLIEPYLREAAAEEGYRLLPAKERPVVMNVKGASASGKSTMRPLQRRLAGELGIRWAEFALISPDIWRKYLLDYDSLGAASKYAGTLTGHELKIVDQKLDRYMAQKAERHAMSHLLIDRFRFDSFTPENDEEEGSRLLTRFGTLVYMFFMITPPDATVERAWKRGLQFGRYKAVDDLLDHNVEAYTGMPQLFFTWALRPDKAVHYEFLDNSVAEGERPRTVAFGWNEEMNVLDLKCMLDVDRYRKINIGAKEPEEVYPDADGMAPERNTEFLRQCAKRIPRLNFVAADTGRVYARLELGTLVWADGEALGRALADPDTRAGLLALAPDILDHTADLPPAPKYLEPEHVHTLGAWGGEE